MAYGKKNTVNLNPLAYNICLLGESKVGKTTLIYNVCKKLVGEDGYMFLEIGSERGADAIEGIKYVNCPEWWFDYDEVSNSVGFADFVEDVVENKSTEYKDLKTVVIDTYDQFITIAEDEEIRITNKALRASGKEKIKTINQAAGGYGRGEKEAIKLMFNAIAELKKVGVSTIILGHVKTKDVTDVITGETYQVITSDQQQNYFNALKKNLHFLGLAYIDRAIAKEKTKGNGFSKTIGKVTGEARRIRFRDDNFSVDSGSRFADIIDEIPMDADAFINAMQDAILAEQSKSGVSIEEAKKKQKKLEDAEAEKALVEESKIKANKKAENAVDELKTLLKSGSSNKEGLLAVSKLMREKGVDVKKLDEADADVLTEIIDFARLQLA